MRRNLSLSLSLSLSTTSKRCLRIYDVSLMLSSPPSTSSASSFHPREFNLFSFLTEKNNFPIKFSRCEILMKTRWKRGNFCLRFLICTTPTRARFLVNNCLVIPKQKFSLSEVSKQNVICHCMCAILLFSCSLAVHWLCAVQYAWSQNRQIDLSNLLTMFFILT